MPPFAVTDKSGIDGFDESRTRRSLCNPPDIILLPFRSSRRIRGSPSGWHRESPPALFQAASPSLLLLLRRLSLPLSVRAHTHCQR